MFQFLRRNRRYGPSGPSHILLAQRQELLEQFGALPDERQYRPDLYPEQLNFQIPDGRAQAAILDGRCHHVMLVLDGTFQDAPLVHLEMYSGAAGWAAIERDDSRVELHFPAFSSSNPGNTYFASSDRTAVALVQQGTPLGSLVVWLESCEYPERLQSYRASRRRCDA